jgi:hypothetical protein
VSILAAAPTGSVLQQLNYGSGDVDIPQLLARIKADLHPGQLAFVDDAATQIIGISAGYGAGKTRALCAKAVMLAAANQGFIGAVMEPTGPLIRDIWQNDFRELPGGVRDPLHLPGITAAGVHAALARRRYQDPVPQLSRTGHASSA